MEQDFEHIKKSLARNRFAIFALVAFLALITYLLIIVSKQVTDQASITTTSKAAELAVEDPLMPIDPITGSPVLSCTNYMDYLESMRENVRNLAKKTSYTIKGKGDVVKGTCDHFLMVSITPTPGRLTPNSLPGGEGNSLPGGDGNSLPGGDGNSLPGGDGNSLPGGDGNSLSGGVENAKPGAKIGSQAPKQCSEVVELYSKIDKILDFMKSKCLQCPEIVTPTPNGRTSTYCPSNGAGPYCGNRPDSLPAGDENSLPAGEQDSLPGGEGLSIPGGEGNSLPAGVQN